MSHSATWRSCTPSVDGNDETLLPSGLIGENNIVEVLVANRFRVMFQSNEKFGSDFEAKLEAANVD